MPTKDEHRARIRGAIMIAVADLNHFNWTPHEDRLLDSIDLWLDNINSEGRAIRAATEALDTIQSAQSQNPTD